MKFMLLLVPVIGAVTGWLIIAAALKVLFTRLVPHKQAQFAASVKQVIEAQLLSAVARDAGIAPELLNGFTDSIARGARERTLKKIPALIPGAVKEKIAGAVEDIVRKEVPALADALVDSIRSGEGPSVILCGLIEEKVRTYDITKLEEDINRSKEIFWLKAGAAAIGLISGCVQTGIFWAVGA